MNVKIITHLFFYILGIGLLSCNKKEFLDARPNSDVFVPTTLDDFQALLDNDTYLSVTPILGELSADNYYVLSSTWQTLGTKERNAYVWASDPYNGEGKVADWNAPYQQVLYANVVLDGLEKNVPRTPANAQQRDAIEGSALFIRAYAFYNLAQVFALPYDSATSSSDLSIPLKLTPNVDEILKRSTVEETYTQILDDLRKASSLLPEAVAYANRNRPNKPAAFAQLARVYLSMRQYDKAGAYADSSLRLKDTLINYNTKEKDTVAPLPFEKENPETLYQSKFVETNVLKGITGRGLIDSTLYRSYAPNDLRRLLFFTNPNPPGSTIVNLKGSYNGTILAFTGLATDEMYLVRAECRARSEDLSGALKDLNTLLRQRYKTGTFVPYTTTTTTEALSKILEERRKEMPCRGVRWTDIRRLNKEGVNITPKRSINGQNYTLPQSYVLPIPPDVTSFDH